MASILLVEDEVLIRMMVAEMLADLGYTVAEAGDLHAGLAWALAADVEAAILDVNLGSDSSEPIADALQRRGAPFCFCHRLWSRWTAKRVHRRSEIAKAFSD